MKLLVEFPFKLLIDSFVFFVGHKVGLELQKRDSGKESQLTWPKDFEKGAEHIPFVMNKEDINIQKMLI